MDAQAGLRLSCLQTPEDRFSGVEAHMIQTIKLITNALVFGKPRGHVFSRRGPLMDFEMDRYITTIINKASLAYSFLSIALHILVQFLFVCFGQSMNNNCC